VFGVDSSELLLVVLVAVVVIGPKDLPRVMRAVGNWVGKARGMASQFRVGVDQMLKDSEIAELEKKWREQNEAIMRANPNAAPVTDWGVPTPAPLPPPDLPVPLGATARPAPAPPTIGKAEPSPVPEVAPVPPRISSRPAPLAPEPLSPASQPPRPAAPEAEA
jgi:sec-independent protein translocase protein TatB